MNKLSWKWCCKLAIDELEDNGINFTKNEKKLCQVGTSNFESVSCFFTPNKSIEREPHASHFSRFKSKDCNVLHFTSQPWHDIYWTCKVRDDNCNISSYLQELSRWDRRREQIQYAMLQLTITYIRSNKGVFVYSILIVNISRLQVLYQW